MVDLTMVQATHIASVIIIYSMGFFAGVLLEGTHQPPPIWLRPDGRRHAEEPGDFCGIRPCCATKTINEQRKEDQQDRIEIRDMGYTIRYCGNSV